jgi:methionine-rich copper-binding protein CopC
VRRIAIALLGLAGAARAQDVSDLMPAQPAPQLAPAGSAAARLYPGLTAPPAGEAPSGGVQVAPARPRFNAVLSAEDLEGNRLLSADRPPPSPEKLPEVHVVRKGDTLWDISGYYFQNPWFWPKVWSFNPLITNPHWIYPGDLVRLYAVGQKPEMPPPMPDKQPETPRVSRAAPAASTGIMLRQNGFVEQGELDAAATIVGSKEEKMMLATLDEAYVESKSQRPLKQGQRYTVYRVVSEVTHPETGSVLGSIVEILGETEVRGVSGKDAPTSKEGGPIAKTVIVDALNPIERGDRVGPLRRQFKLVEPAADRKNIDGMVVAALRPTRLVGSEMLVFLDKGRDDGVEVGNRFVVVRRGDGYQPLLADVQTEDERYPREVIAEVLVVDVREKTCTGVVTRALKEVQMGDRVQARKGY